MAGSDNISKRITIYINGKEVENSVKAIRAEYAHLNNSINKTTIGTEEYEQKVEELKKAKAILDEHNAKIRGVGAAWDKSKTSAGGAMQIMQGVLGADLAKTLAQGVVDAGKKLFHLGTEMELLSAKAQTVFGHALPMITEEAEKNAASMGMTITQYTNAATAIGDLLIPMGFQRAEAANISSQLVNLSGALSEWSGGQRSAEEVTKILSKAMLGEREELKSLGISIQEADVQARLHEKGLKDLTGTMLQQAKAVATLELVMEKSADAQTAFANNAGSNLRMQAEAAAKIQNAWERMALALAPVWTKLSAGGLNFATTIDNMSESVSRFLAKPISKEYQEQQANLNRLVAELIDANDNQEKKSKIISELQAKYPDFLKNIDVNTASEGELRTALQASNEQYRVRILLATLQDQVDKKQSRVNKEVDRQTKAQVEYATALAQVKTEAGNLNPELEQQLLLMDDVNEITQLLEREGLLKVTESFKDGATIIGGPLADSYQQLIRYKNEVGTTSFRLEGRTNKLNETLSKQDQVIAQLKASFPELAGFIDEVEKTMKGMATTAETTGNAQINYAKLTMKELQAIAGAGDELALKEIAKREKAADAAKKRGEREVKELENKQTRLLEFIKKGNDDRRIADLDENKAAIERIKLKYQEQIDITEELEKRKYEDAAANRQALERLRDAEIDQYNEARIKKLSAAADKLADSLGLRSVSAFSKEQQEIRAKFTELIADAEKMATEGSAKGQMILDELNKTQSAALQTLSDKYFTQILEDKDKLLNASKKSAANIISTEVDGIKMLYQKKIDEILLHEQENHNLSEQQQTLLHEARVQLAMQREEDLGNAKHTVSKKFFDLLKEVEGETLDETLVIMDQLYNELKTSAEGHEIDLTDITRKYVALRNEVVKKGNDDLLDEQEKARAAEVKMWQARAQLFGDFGNAFSALADILADETTETLKFKRAATLAQIAFDTGAAISSAMAASTANPANPFTFGGAGLAQFAAVLSAIIAGMAKASAVLATPIPQKFMGGLFGPDDKKNVKGEAVGDYFSVVGAEDSKRYEAQYIGAQSTGMLPDKPSLVLASEKGSEYFVSNEDLQKPAVANYVRMIENIRTNRVPQKADGGFSNPSGDTGVPSSPAADPESIKMISEIRNFLSILINQGVRATTVLDDDTIVRTNQRFEEINNISGGSIRGQ